MLKAFLFDMDGVLYDSMKNHAESWYQTAQFYGVPASREQFYLYEGQTGEQTINCLFREQKGREASEDEIHEIYGMKSRLFTELPKAEVMDGALDVLRKVGELGFTRVIVTGSGQASLLDKLSANFPGIFDSEHIVSAKDTPAGMGKPNPAPYLKGLQKAGDLTPDQAVVVENAPLGVRAAKAAGIFCIAVNTGPLPDEVLANEGADVVLSGMKELASRLPAILEEYHLL